MKCPVLDPAPEAAVCPVDHSARLSWLDLVRVSVDDHTSEDPAPAAGSTSAGPPPPLPTDREILSIPRTDGGNWVYPLPKQFYEAMKRKNWNPSAGDMTTVVPIHNHVNEIAWRHILLWERSFVESTKSCGGHSLTNFKGDLKKMTPRAWFKTTVLGQDPPFDRHDWTVDRCGVAVPYVIDFYGTGTEIAVDVRPKLQLWEGLKLRVGRALGFL